MNDETIFWLNGDEEFQFDIVGESQYQDNLLAICGPKTADGFDLIRLAAILHDLENQYDENAMAVMIAKRVVGYLSRDDAADFRDFLDDNGITGAIFVYAKITGGWKREKNGKTDEGYFGVVLDIGWPLTPIPITEILSIDDLKNEGWI